MDNNFDYQYLEKKNKSINLKKIFLIIIVFLVILVIGFIVYNKYINSYNYLENRLEKEAQKYVEKNHLENNKSFYLEAKKLNVKLKDNCYSMSGVLVEKNEYKPYLMCSDYETELNNKKSEYIKLNGRELVFLNRGDEYVEAYYETIVPVEVDINSNVGTLEGVYNVNYIIKKDNTIINNVTRKVIVLDNREINNFEPTIILNGDEIEYLEFNTNYVDKGAKSFDSLDGSINNIMVTGKVNPILEGEYKLTYTVINSRGFAKSVNRKVIVLSGETDISINYEKSTNNLTNSSIIISLAIYGDDYSYTILPNGEKTTEKNIKYEAIENSSYNFQIYANDEFYKDELIMIDNIDKEKPTGVCSGYYLDYKSYITVDAKDNNGISHYIVNGIKYNNKEITLDGELKEVKVNIYDGVGNYSEISCQLEDKNPVTSACNDKTIYPGNKYTFTEKQKKKMAAMVSFEADGHPQKAEDYLGMKLVASHMCNYYEKLYPNEEWTGNRLHWLITTSGWYAEVTKNARFNPNNERHHLALKAVEEVMEKGNRILPHYIDEFDKFPDDVMRPLSNIEGYVRDETIYYGFDWIKVTFWCINTPNGKSGNIFGYTKKPSEYN